MITWVRRKVEIARGIMMWRHIIIRIKQEIQKTPVENHEQLIGQLRSFEGMLGHAVLHFIGVHETHDWL